MGSTSSGSQTATTKPWADSQRQALKDVYGRAGELIDQPLEYGPSTVAPFSGATERALTGIEQYGMGSGPVQRAGAVTQEMMRPGGVGGGPGRGLMQRTAQGSFLGANPYLDQMYDRAAERFTDQYQTQIAPGIDSRFAAGGRLGSGYHARAQADARSGLGDQLGNLATDIYSQDYARERGFMDAAQRQLAATEQDDARVRLAAAGMAPQLSAAQLAQYQAALGAGSARDDLTATQLLEDQARFRYGQEAPYMTGMRANELLGGSSRYAMQTQPLTRNPAAGFLGGAAGGAGIGAMIGTPFGGPAGAGIGAGIGAGLGGLLGAL